ncbi:MAG: LysE family translocator [Spirochaetales bacterium]|nr:LysE family translocator [Spirochaetales bacterium]
MNTIILPVILFTITMTITPGPNNMILTVSGAKFGFKKCLPMIIGIVIGLESQLILWSFGLGIIFQKFPFIQTVLKVAGTAYIIYLAIMIAFKSHNNKNNNSYDKPFSILQAAGFQYLNPKCYIMTITAMSVFPLDEELYTPSTFLIFSAFLFITPISVSVWAYFGTILKKLLSKGKNQKFVNYFLGALTAASAVFIVI